MHDYWKNHNLDFLDNWPFFPLQFFNYGKLHKGLPRCLGAKKNPPASARDTGDTSSIPGVG